MAQPSQERTRTETKCIDERGRIEGFATNKSVHRLVAVARRHANFVVPRAANPQFPVRREATIGRIVLLGPVEDFTHRERRAVATGGRWIG